MYHRKILQSSTRRENLFQFLRVMKWDQFFSTTNELTPNKDTGYCSSPCNFGHVGLDFIHVWFVFDFKYLDFGFVNRIGIQNSLKIVEWKYKLINQGTYQLCKTMNMIYCPVSKYVRNTGMSGCWNLRGEYLVQMWMCVCSSWLTAVPKSGVFTYLAIFMPFIIYNRALFMSARHYAYDYVGHILPNFDPLPPKVLPPLFI